MLRSAENTLLAAAALVAALVGESHADFLREPVKDPGLECASYDSEGWLTIFDGTQASAEKYWWISNASHGDGGHWWVADDPAAVTAGKLPAGRKVIWSDQNPGGNGGLLYTQRRYKDFEVRISIFPGWMNDGGLFLRSNGKGQAWQVMIDYIAGKTIGGMWPEGLSGPSQDFISLASETKVDARLAKWNMADWPKIWDPDGFNTIQARVQNDPSHITAFITDSLHPVTDYQTTVQSVITGDGYIGLQIHAGVESWKGGPSRYQWIRVRELTPGTGKPICPPIGVSSIAGAKEKDLSLDWKAIGNNGLSVSGSAPEAYSLALVDVHGRTVAIRNGGAGAWKEDFSGVKRGVYVLRLSTAKGSANFRAVRF